MKNSHTGLTKRAGMLSATVAALGLVLGLAFVAPAGAQDGGDNYTTVGPTGDATGTTGGTTGPGDVGADSAVPPSGPSAPSGPSGPGGTTSGGGVPGTGSTGGGVPGAGVPITTSGPLARTGFGATLPSLLATALVAGGAMLVITVARRRRTN